MILDQKSDLPRQEKLVLSRIRLEAIENATEQFVKKACNEGELEIPETVQKSLVQQTVRSVLSAALPQEQPLHLQYRNRPNDPDTGRRETVAKYLDRVWYDPFIAAGVFTRPYFRSVDEAGAQALQNQLRADKRALPFDVPRLSDVNDSEVGTEIARHAARVASARWRRASAQPDR